MWSWWQRVSYRITALEKNLIASQIQKILESDIIKPSTRPVGSGIVLVSKKETSAKWICIDCRVINQTSKHYSFYIRNMNDTLFSVRTLRRCRYFWKLNLASGYWQINIAEKIRRKPHSGLILASINSKEWHLKYMHLIYSKELWTTILR